jgi:hypothetical protein
MEDVVFQDFSLFFINSFASKKPPKMLKIGAVFARIWKGFPREFTS